MEQSVGRAPIWPWLVLGAMLGLLLLFFPYIAPVVAIAVAVGGYVYYKRSADPGARALGAGLMAGGVGLLVLTILAASFLVTWSTSTTVSSPDTQTVPAPAAPNTR